MLRATSLFVAFLIALGTSTPARGECASVYFGNGILATRDEANAIKDKLGEALCASIDCSQVEFKTAVNDNDPTLGGRIAAFHEALVQAVANDFTYAWRLFSGLDPLPPPLRQLFLDSALQVESSLAFTTPNLATHIAEYTTDREQLARTVVLVPHSQGNFFANLAYPQLSQAAQAGFHIVSVASPAPVVGTPNSTFPHTTLFEDLVVDAIRVAKSQVGLPPPLPPTTTNLPAVAFRDPFNHYFVESYLAEGSNSRAHILADVSAPLRPAILQCAATREIAYSTYLGGPQGGNGGLGNPYAMAVDAQGGVVVTGIDGPGFPLANAIQSTIEGFDDIFLAKLDRNGQVVFSTYLGGSPLAAISGEGSTVVATGPGGEVYLGGFSRGMTWPLLGGQYVDSGWIMRLDPNGSQIELFTTQLYDIPGFGYRFNYPTAIKVAADGNVVVLGLWTFDPGGNSWSPFIAKLTPQGTPIWQLSLASALTSAHDLAIDGLGNIYIAGRAGALTPVNPIPGVQRDNDDVAIARVSDTGAVTGLTVIGGTASGSGAGDDAVLDLFVDPTGQLTLIGSTGSPNFPTTQGVMGPLFPPNSASAGFVARLEIGATPGAASTLFSSTFIDPAILDRLFGTMATTGEVTLVGYPGAAFAPTTPALGSVGIARLAGDLSAIDYATRFGSQTGTAPYFVAGHQSTEVLVSGTTGAGLPTSATAPTQFPSFQAVHGGGIDTFVAKLAMPAPPPPVPE